MILFVKVRKEESVLHVQGRYAVKKGDLVEWNYGKYRQVGVLIKKSGRFGWVVYFSKGNKINHMEASSLRKIQESE